MTTNGPSPATPPVLTGGDVPPAQPLPTEGLDAIRFGADGLVPAVVQDRRSGEVLMVGFMNRDMLAKTLETGDAWFWSRSRQEPWHKGATSGSFIRVREVRRNCEDNSLLLLADPVGPVCHTGARACYYRALDGRPILAAQALFPSGERADSGDGDSGGRGQGLPVQSQGDLLPSAVPAGRKGDLDWLYEILRQPVRREGSYVAKLLTGGVDRIGKKIGEEAAEVIIAAKNRSADELSGEMADLWFHSLVLLMDAGLAPADVYRVLLERHQAKTT